MGDLDAGGPLAPRCPARSPDQGIGLAAVHVVEAPEPGRNAMPRLAGLVAAGFRDAQLAPPPRMRPSMPAQCRAIGLSAA